MLAGARGRARHAPGGLPAPAGGAPGHVQFLATVAGRGLLVLFLAFALLFRELPCPLFFFPAHFFLGLALLFRAARLLHESPRDWGGAFVALAAIMVSRGEMRGGRRRARG